MSSLPQVFSRWGHEGREGLARAAAFSASRGALHVFLLLLLALAIRLPFMPMRGYEPDVTMYAEWTWKAQTHGIHTLYERTAGVWSDNHPAILYPLKVIGWAYQHLFEPDFRLDEARESRVLRFLLRVPAVLCDLLMGLVVYAAARRRMPHQKALLGLAAFVFNPAIIFNSACYGQVDACHSLLAVASMVLIAGGRIGLGWGLMGVGFMTKPQAYILGPLLVLATFRRHGWRGLVRGGSAALLGMLLPVSPFLAHGTFPGLVSYMLGIEGLQPVVSANADNFWWWVVGGRAIGIADHAPFPPFAVLGLPVDYRTVGLVLLLVLLLLPLYRAWQRPYAPPLYEWGAFSVAIFFNMATQMHENYLYLALPLLALTRCTERRLGVLYVLLSVTCTANMALHFPQIVAWLVPQNPDIYGGSELLWPRYAVSVANTCALFGWLWAVRHGRRPAAAGDVCAEPSVPAAGEAVPAIGLPLLVEPEVHRGPRWALRVLVAVCLGLVAAAYLRAVPMYIADPDETGYLDMSYYAGTFPSIAGWNVRTYFYPLVLCAAKTIACAFQEGGVCESLHAFRAANLCIASLAVVFAYVLARRLFGEAAALCAAAMLGTSPVWLDQASHQMMEAPFAAFCLGATGFLILGLTGRRTWPFAASAALAGAAVMTKFDGLVLLVLLPLLGLIVGVRRGRRVTAGFTFGLTFAVMATCLMAMDALYWGQPFESWCNFYVVNFVEKWWTRWYPARIPASARLAALAGSVSWPCLGLAAIGLAVPWRRSPRLGAALAASLGLWMGVRLGMHYYLPRFWITLLPLVFVLSGAGLAWLTSRLLSLARARPGWVHLAVPLALVFAGAAVTLPRAVASARATARERSPVLDAAVEVGKASEFLLATNGAPPSVAAFSPVLTPAFPFPHCEFTQYYFVEEMTPDVMKKHDILLLPSPLPSSVGPVPPEFAAPAEYAATGLRTFLRKDLEPGRVVMHANALVDGRKTTGWRTFHGWVLSSNGSVDMDVAVDDEGPFQVVIQANGTPAGGVFPNMTLRVDGREAAHWGVAGDDWKPYASRVLLTRGTHRLGIDCDNDTEDSPEDRHLAVGSVIVSRFTARPRSQTDPGR